MLQKQKQKKTGKEVNKSIASNTMAFFAFIQLVLTEERRKRLLRAGGEGDYDSVAMFLGHQT